MFWTQLFKALSFELSFQSFKEMFCTQLFKEFIVELVLQYAVEMFWTQAFRAQKLLDTFWRQVFKEFIIELSFQHTVEMFWTQEFKDDRAWNDTFPRTSKWTILTSFMQTFCVKLQLSIDLSHRGQCNNCKMMHWKHSRK